ncbi:hypothetical protein [Pedobacter heparinus]|uniref:Uncharacterized protein n=1 Tax=Pedobacter heparinus (strain ATCC 13125 / DSM 2366 / CIP 104194 / JCM 7457 / NBRC 12017 / NCIMB 9290 / NRRL B-14731 / HIM 762-3) TaxID=485917 RepID=C6Y3M0_PEDHD|nr:hypothetical protein [Pedobacter heparinus]ACU03299.1 hypothetical protein Phep_1081 [Pedobacter heparinus DSM 2366]
MKEELLFNEPFPAGIEQHIPALEKVLSALPEKGYLTTLHEYALDDRVLLHKMIFRFLSFSFGETVKMLQGLILYQKRGSKLNEIEKERIEQVTLVLMRRARDYRQAGDLVKAVELAFVVLTTIEPELEYTEITDWVYDTILEDASDFMTELVKCEIALDLKQELYEMIQAYLKAWKPRCGYMKGDCEEWLKALDKRRFFKW